MTARAIFNQNSERLRTMSLRHNFLFTAVLNIFLMTPIFAPTSLGQTKSSAKTSPHSNAKAAPARPTATSRNAGVRTQFEQAQALYTAGQFAAALQAYDAILRQYPGHEPSTVQLAKTLYRLDRIAESYTIFSRINPQGLDAETSYEYGWSFYTNKQWAGALSGFQRVPKDHALYDLANYYGAICAVKLRRYDAAEDMLEKAVVLPDKLATSRALYIKHVQELKLMQQKNSLSKERLAEQDRLQQEAANNKKTTKNPTAPEDKAFKHTGMKSIDKSAIVTYQHKQQLNDFHGTKEERFKSAITSFELLAGPLLPLPWKPTKDRAAVFGVQLQLLAKDKLTEGSEQRLIIDESNQDLIEVLTTNEEVKHVKEGTVGLEPFFELPLPAGIWLALGGDINFTYPEFERGDRKGYRKGYIGLGGKVQNLEYETEVGYSEILDHETKPISSRVNGDFKTTLKLPSKLEVGGKIKHAQFDYLDEVSTVDGPDSSTSLGLEIEQKIPFGFALSSEAIYELQANNVVHDIPSFDQVAADGQIMTGVIKLTADPFPWFTATLEQRFVKSTWKQDNDAARDAFETNVVDYVEQFSAEAGINMWF